MGERRAVWWGGLFLSGWALAGCGGGPEPLTASHRERWVEREQAAARPAGRCPEGTLIPADAWRQRLEEELPAPWRLGSIDAQVTAPPGWSKREGDRGVEVWLTDGTSRQTYFVAPRGWKGQVFDPAIAAHELARTEDLTLYAPHHDAPGWASTAIVERALGFTTAEVASKD